MATTNTPDLATITENILAESAEMGLASDVLPAEVRAAASDFARAIRDKVSAADQLGLDLNELHAKRDLLPEHGANRLRREALADAEAKVADAERRQAEAMKTLRAGLLDAASPQIDKAREALARQELEVAIGNAEGGAARSRAVSIAENGSNEAIAAMLSPFGTTLLQARGVTGRDLEEVLHSAKVIARSKVTERGGTARQLVAAKASTRLDRLASANSAAGSYFHSIARP